MELKSSISEIKGIGAKTAQLFHKIGVYTVGDILLHFPRDYERMPAMETVAELLARETAEGELAAVAGGVERAPVVRNTGRMPITTLTLREGDYTLNLVWFHMPYLKNSLKHGSNWIFLGKLSRSGNRLSLDQPQVLAPEKYQQMQGSLMPCYALTQGLSKNMVSKTVRLALDSLDLGQDYLTEDIRQRQELAEWNFALENIHFPVSEQALAQARKRLVFDEFFQFILAAGLQ